MNTLMKSICTFFFLIAFTNISYGQNSKREKIEQLKIAFITNELELTSEEEEKFWPIYNEMESKIRVEKRKQRKIEQELREYHATLSGDENKAKAMAVFESEKQEIEVKKTYYTKIGAQIGYSKATKLLSLEQKFKRELMQQLKENRPPSNQAKPRPNRN